METKILGISKKTQLATVRFSQGELTLTRAVNPVFVDGKMDKEATNLRIEEIAIGIAKKIERGVIF